MYSFIRGKLVEIREQAVVLDVGGIGYLLSTPQRAELPALGDELTLHVSLVIRENSHALYGFLDPSERDLFEILLTISGIGPKTGLALISHLDPSELQETVLTGNAKRLTSTPGIGKKTAERLILELKGKIDKLIFTSQGSLSSVEREAISALVHLGHSPKIAAGAVEKAMKAGEARDLASLIRRALAESN